MWNGFKSFLDLFLQSNCPLCQRPTETELCQYCQRQLLDCQLTNPSQLWQGEIPAFAWGNYTGALKRAIAALKYENQPQLAQPLGRWMGEAWLKSKIAAKTPKLTVVPIPLHGSKLQQRGYNQAELLARSFCNFTGLRLQSKGLQRVRSTEAQFGLSIAQREQNLANAFKIDRPPGSPVLLLDDIYTTGATARSAAQILQQSGILVYGLVAIAAPQLGRSVKII
ncbi:MAG: ComF family protein [Cyanosarcina radialis HA8281-LM2]|jgi:ComF family protein|nr:ComF family protein [Cyanosarcina radialis HA8281-LM2]